MDPLGVLTQGEREYGLGVGTPVAMMATNTGALARYGFQPSRRQASAAWFVHVMHLTQKRGDIPWSCPLIAGETSLSSRWGTQKRLCAAVIGR
jgi:hypothetical protein